MKVLTPRQQQRRDDILAAARKLIGERGYQGVTMRDLAQASTVTLKTLYHQFDNKENLLAIAVADRYRAVYQRIDQTVKPTGLDKLLYIMQAISAAMAENVAYARALAPFLSGHASHPEFVNIRLATYHLALMQIADEGELQDWIDAKHLAHLIYRQGVSLYLAWSRGEIELALYASVAQLDACMVLASATTGDTQQRSITIAKQLQRELQNQNYYQKFSL